VILPILSEVQKTSKKYSVAFKGINYGEGTLDGEFAETYNLSSDQYPCITQRATRLKVGEYTKPTTLHAKGKLLVIDGTDVIYGGEKVGEVTEGRKQTATIGNYIVIFPDKKYYKVPTEDDKDGEFGDMEIIHKVTGAEFTTSSIKKEGAEFTFEKGDSVTITGSSQNENNKTEEIIIRSATADELTFDADSFTEVTEDAEVEITISRTVPDLDFICESNYRLWGTHGNTIYASAWSKPCNFKSFEGLANDSYYIDMGSEGEFTGCIPYASHICFFKENTLHKLYGTKPSNFQVTTVNVYGVQSGSERSMQIVNEQLLYKGVGGVYAYTGGVPELISDKFGNRRYAEAVACCDGEKYYISMKQDNNWNLFAYDVAKNIWLREDDTHAVDMAFYDGKVYFLDAEGGLYHIDKTVDNNDVEWGATFCTINETMYERKGYSKFQLRMDLSAGAWLSVDIKTDNEPLWRQIYTTHNEKAKTVSIPIMPTRCDSIDIRLRGKGKCTIKTFIREFSIGSDV
jgi:hypothetical protein